MAKQRALIAHVKFASLYVAAVLSTATVSAQGSQELRFDIQEYRVLGNSTLPVAEIEAALYPLLGKQKSIEDVESARQRLEQLYRDRGYGTVFVDIPEQETGAGIVRLRVTEGRLDRVRITGARYFANGQIRAALPALKRGTVPHLPAVQEQLAALNRGNGDRAVVPVLRAGRTPGTVDVELKVADELPLHGTLEMNDRYTANTSRWRLNTSLSYGNLFQKQHSLSLQYQTAPEEPKDVQVLVGSYVLRFDSLPNTTFAVYAVDSETDVAAIGTLSVLGNGEIYGARAIRGLPSSTSYFHNVTFGVDYKDFLENIRLSDFEDDADDAEEELLTPIRYINWSIAYAGTRRSEHLTSGFDLAANFGITDFVNDATEFATKRFKGQANYFYLRGSMQHAYTLPWHFRAFARIAGQFTQSPLVSNEQFAIGGVDTVRGYLESTQLGDYGASATVELRSAWLLQPLQLSPDAAHLFVFYDAGTAAIIDPLPSQSARFELASAGVGLRLLGWHGLDLTVDWATALRDGGAIERGEDRVHVLFKYGF